MYNFTEIPIDYLKTRRIFLKPLVESLQDARSTETNSFSAINLRNGLITVQQELTAIENELLGRGELVCEQLPDGTVTISEK